MEETKKMTKKQEYIGAYLDGYFSDKKVEYGMHYYSMLNSAIDDAEKKWKKYQKLEFPKQNIIDEWLDKNGCPEIKKQVEEEALELLKETQSKKEKGRIEIIFLNDETFEFKVENLSSMEVIGALTFCKDERLIDAFKNQQKNKQQNEN
jgi:hypothetical protein